VTWPDWTRWYAAAFSLRTEQDADMLTAWVELFTSRGWGADEVHAACRLHFDRLAGARYRTQHLEVVSEAVQDARRAADYERSRQLRAEQEDPRGVCCDCFGVGVVCGLPYPDDRKWERGCTCAAYCHCPLGRWKAGQETEPKYRLPTYEQYTARVPDWRDKLRAKAQTQAAERAAQGISGHLDKTVGSILRNVQARQQTKGV
jgi:hypothetical protein